jgi:large subunit ribosomal protein L10
MNRDQKAAVIDEIAGEITASEAIFAVDYRGITVAQAVELRERLREAETHFRVVKNSLTERAADQAGVDILKPLLIGPTALAIVRGDAALAAKHLNDTARATNNILEFKGGIMNGAALSADDVRSIARLPSREVLTAQLVGTIAAPLSGLVRTLNALIAGVAIQLKAIADQGLVSGEAPTVAAAVEQAEAAEAAAEPTPEEQREDEPTAAATPETVEAPEPQELPEPEPEPAAEPEVAAEPEAAAEPGAPAEPEAAAEAEAPTEPIVDVQAEPGDPPPAGETDEDVAPDEEPGA